MPIPSATDALDRDVPCLGCRYNLRGLRPDGTCPECGRSIADSLRGNLLRHADPLWVQRLALAATIAVVGVVCQEMVWITYFGGMIIQDAISPSHIVFGWLHHLFNLMSGLAVLGIPLINLGQLVLAAPQRAPGESGGRDHLRMLLRITALASFIFYFLGGYILSPTGTWASMNHMRQMLFLVACLFFFAMLARLARRLPEPFLTRHLPILMILFSGAGVLAMAYPQWVSHFVGGDLASARVIAGLLFLCVCIYEVLLLLHFRRRALAAAIEARENWNRPVAAVKGN